MMKTLKAWLDEERGRYTALALHLGVSVGRVSQMAEDGVPPKFMLTVRDFTEGAVSLEALVVARTPGAEPEAAPKPEKAASAAPQAQGEPEHANGASKAQREKDGDRKKWPNEDRKQADQRRRTQGDKPSNRKGR